MFSSARSFPDDGSGGMIAVEDRVWREEPPRVQPAGRGDDVSLVVQRSTLQKERNTLFMFVSGDCVDNGQFLPMMTTVQ